MTGNIHKLKEKFQLLQAEVLDVEMSKSVNKEELKDLHNEVETAQEKLSSATEAFNMKYEELKEACSQAQNLQNYIERLKNGQNYQELEATVRNEVGRVLLDNRELLKSALISVVVALRSYPYKYLLIDRMDLTPFSTSTIINYESFLSLRRPPIPKGIERFATERVLEMAETVLNNLQKSIVDSTISYAAGLEKGSYPVTYQALPYYGSPSHLPRYFAQNSSDNDEISNY